MSSKTAQVKLQFTAYNNLQEYTEYPAYLKKKVKKNSKTLKKHQQQNYSPISVNCISRNNTTSHFLKFQIKQSCKAGILSELATAHTLKK